jgi:hypothetical protein
MTPQRLASLLALTLGLGAAVAPGSAQAPAPAAAGTTTGATVAGKVVASGPQAGFGERLALGVGATLAPALEPHTAGAAPRFVPRLDGADLPLAQWTGPWAPGEHIAGGRVETDAAALGEVPPLAFVYDPVAPTLELQIDTPEVLDAHGLDQQVDDPVPPRRSRLPKQVPVAWGSHGVRWLALLPKGDSSAQWTVEADRPQVFLWPAAGVALRSGGEELRLETGQVARLVSTDEHTAVARLVMDVTETPDGARLVVTAIDLVGNRTSREWAVRPTGRR